MLPDGFCISPEAMVGIVAVPVNVGLANGAPPNSPSIEAYDVDVMTFCPYDVMP
jgi:ribosomal protein L11